MNVEDINEPVELTTDDAHKLRGGWYGLVVGWRWTWPRRKPEPAGGGASGMEMEEEEMQM